MNICRRGFIQLALATAGSMALVACGKDEAPSAGPSASLTVTFLKVGKADAIVCQTQDSCVMVDTGTAKSADDVVDSLASLGVAAIDTLIITHFDQDHVGGAAAVLDNFEVGEVLCTYQSKESDEIDAYEQARERRGVVARELSGTTSFTLDGTTYTIVAPDRASYVEDTSNNSSLVTRVNYGATRILLAGDVQYERIEELLGNGTDLTCDLIKMPHHGRYEDNTQALIEAAAPRYAVITSSKSDKEDHEVEELLETAGAEILLTRKGAVTATTDGSSLTVVQE